MRRSMTKYLLSVGLLSLGSLALMPSCAENNSSLFVVGVLDINSTTCVAKPDTSSGFLAAGTLDLAFASSYSASVLVGNQLTQRGDRTQLRTETSRISLRGAEVTLTTLDGKALGNYSTVGTGFVDASSGDTPAYATMSVQIIPSALAANPAVRAARVILAKIRVFGDTLGNTSVTSSELDFPINICEGCLVKYDVAGDPTETTYKCPPASATTQTTDAEPCVRGQDLTFSCSSCAATYTLCRDPALNPSYAPVATP